MKHIYLILLLFIIASGSTNKAHAQFGLFDTVWTINNLAENHSMWKSPNDSLFIVWTYEKDTLPAYYFSRFRLFKTISKEVIWDTTKINFGEILSNNLSVLTWDSNKVTIRDLFSLEPISTATFKRSNFSTCQILWGGVSEVDTSVYYSGYCGATAIKGISYKVNYKTGVTKITTDSLPYFAMTISEDGQYVAGVYYTGGTAINDPYNEVIEVRKISDYRLVFRDSKYYSDYTPEFYPYSWVSGYQLKFSKDNKYLAVLKGKINVFNLLTGENVFERNYLTTGCAVGDNGIFFFLRNITNFDNSETNLICYYDCEKNKYEEKDYPDSNKVLFFASKNLMFKNQYLLTTITALYNPKTKYYNNIGDVTLLKLNFDITSIQEPELKYEGTLYPNPTTDYITVGVQNIEHLQGIEIYNIFGERILSVETQCITSLQRIDVSSLPPGVYFVKVGNEKPNKFIKL